MLPSIAASSPRAVPRQAATAWRWVGLGILMLCYAVLSHWLTLHAAIHPWAVAALFGPLLLAVTLWSLRLRQWLTLAVCLVLVVVLVAVVHKGAVADVNRLALAQHVGMHLFLGWSFAHTLREGRTALISVLASRVHRGLSPGLARYTRRLTAAWAVYFFAMATSSLLLYALAPWWWWSLFANILTPIAVAVLFVGEYLMRFRWHPEFERASLIDALRAYRAPAAGPPAPPAA